MAIPGTRTLSGTQALPRTRAIPGTLAVLRTAITSLCRRCGIIMDAAKKEYPSPADSYVQREFEETLKNAPAGQLCGKTYIA